MRDHVREFVSDRGGAGSDVLLRSRRFGLLTAFALLGSLLASMAFGAIVLFLPASIPQSWLWSLGGSAVVLALVSRLLVIRMAKRLRPSWNALAVRRWWSSQVQRGGLAAAALWIAGVVAGEAAGSRSGIGDLQFLLLIVGFVGGILALVIGHFYRSFAKVWMPVVGRPGADADLQIEGVSFMTAPASQTMSDTAELTLVDGEDAEGRWWEVCHQAAALPLGDIWLAVYDLREAGSTPGFLNLVHLAANCVQACSQALILPPGVAVGVLEVDRPGALGLLAPSGTLRDMVVPSNSGIHALREGFRRNRSSEGFVEVVDSSPIWLSRRLLHRESSKRFGA